MTKQSKYKRAIGYLVLPFGAWHDNEADYVHCQRRDDVVAQLADMGWMANPAVPVWKLVEGEEPMRKARELSADVDPYPDWLVERGPRGGVVWSRT